jgi:CheY-like chemotaxis protein
MRILFVDDEAGIRDSCCIYLNSQGYFVQGCCNATEALEWVKEHFIDLMFTDLQMPGMSGTELIKELRKIAEYKDIPIVLVTDSVPTDFSLDEYGVVKVLSKPIFFNALSDVIKKIRH